ncbi:MAG: helix-turn-helix domain-containing protein [Burkholderiaceae bacterium]|nr:helix-turn-helix domain-containing protein [Burkholderiaceae bacterium]
MAVTIRNSKELGEAIRAERLRRNLRQVDLASLASVRQALISNLENGANSARADTLLKVLAALDMDLALVPRRKAEFNPTEY